MSIGQIILARYENANPLVNFSVSKLRTGIAIDMWKEDELGPKPTIEELERWGVDHAKEMKTTAKEKKDKKDAFDALDDEQIDAAGPDELKEILKTMLANMRSN